MSIFLHGDISAALFYNPLSVVFVALFAVAAVWLVVDLIRGKKTFIERIRKPLPKWIIPVAAVLMLINWAGNIVKGI